MSPRQATPGSSCAGLLFPMKAQFQVPRNECEKESDVKMGGAVGRASFVKTTPSVRNARHILRRQRKREEGDQE